jgi:hypothetical protein
LASSTGEAAKGKERVARRSGDPIGIAAAGIEKQRGISLSLFLRQGDEKIFQLKGTEFPECAHLRATGAKWFGRHTK